MLGLELAEADFGSDEGFRVHSEFDETKLALLDLFDNLVCFHQGATLLVGHQAFRSQDPGVSLQVLDVFLCANDFVVLDLPVADVLQGLVVAEDVCSHGFEVRVELAISEYAHFDFFACTRWQNTGASDHLVTLGGVDA